jgi:hypothetical protein
VGRHNDAPRKRMESPLFCSGFQIQETGHVCMANVRETAMCYFYPAAYLRSIEYLPGPVIHNSSKPPMIDTFL